MAFGVSEWLRFFACAQNDMRWRVLHMRCKGVFPVHLYHYFDKTVGAFVSLSDLTQSEATAVLASIKATKPLSQSASRNADYMARRQINEEKLRTLFLKKGGIIKRQTPHYMVVEHSPWISTWFESGGFVKIPIAEFDVATISFTYGDSFPVFSENPHRMDNMEFRRQLYTYDEILQIIDKYGFPQDWNDNGTHGPCRYIEAHVWSDETINRYRG